MKQIHLVCGMISIDAFCVYSRFFKQVAFWPLAWPAPEQLSLDSVIFVFLHVGLDRLQSEIELWQRNFRLFTTGNLPEISRYRSAGRSLLPTRTFKTASISRYLGVKSKNFYMKISYIFILKKVHYFKFVGKIVQNYRHEWVNLAAACLRLVLWPEPGDWNINFVTVIITVKQAHKEIY